MAIPFNRPHAVGSEIGYIGEALVAGHLSGDGGFTRRCSAWLEQEIGAARALLTHSCTAALEICAFLMDAAAGDEIIMPSYTFVSTANAFALRGAIPVFVDIDPRTLNIDERLITSAITAKTKAIVAVHYAGVACNMDVLAQIADEHGLLLVEDAAQALDASYKGRPLGSIGHLAAMSFHETKSVICGEGGALLINDPRFIERAEIIREKGTNRSRFFRGEVDKYTWVDLGSSYLPSELVAAFLWGQFEVAHELTARRLSLWQRYHEAFAELELAGVVRRPIIPSDATHNGHLYYLIARDTSMRTQMLEELNARGIRAIFHYVPLHSSPAGRRYGRAEGSLNNTDALSARVVRLPLWHDLSDAMIEEVIGAVRAACTRIAFKS